MYRVVVWDVLAQDACEFDARFGDAREDWVGFGSINHYHRIKRQRYQNQRVIQMMSSSLESEGYRDFDDAGCY
jgi:hypothetical protein